MLRKYRWKGIRFVIVLPVAFLLSCIGKKEAVKNQFDIFLQGNFCNGFAMVEHEGEILYRESIESVNSINRQVKTDSRVALASLSKVFTKIVVLRLVEEGKLELDKKIVTYRPYFRPSFGKQVTVQQLVDMTSGLPRELETDEMSKVQFDSRLCAGNYLDTIPELELAFEPGSDKAYSNLGYWLLGSIIESVTGKNLDEAFNEFLFEPLQMKNSGLIQSSTKRLVNGHVSRDGKWLEDRENYGGRYASGGCYSTTDDLLKLAKALKGNTLLSKQMKVHLLNEDDVLEGYGYLPSHTNMLYFDYQHDFFMIVLNHTAISDPDQMVSLKTNVLEACGITTSKSGGNVVKVSPIESLSESHPIESVMIDWINAIENGNSSDVYSILNEIAVANAFEKKDPTWKEIIRCRETLKGFRCAGFRWKEGTQMDGLEIWFETDSEAAIGFLWILNDSKDAVSNLFVSPSDMEWLGEKY